MRYLAPAFVLALAGCAAVDIHGPKTVVAPAQGGQVTVTHGNRLRLPLATKANDGYEWRRVEPQVLTIVAEGAAEPDGCTPAELRAILTRDMEKLAGLLKEAGIPGQGRN